MKSHEKPWKTMKHLKLTTKHHEKPWNTSNSMHQPIFPGTCDTRLATKATDAASSQEVATMARGGPSQ